jgi:prepilin-type N-terminal cleavage/methylation domain-containing protein
MMRARGRSGLTLIEVLLAAALLGLGLASLLGGLSNCLAVMKASREYQQAQWVIGLGELTYPIREVEEIDELEVDPDSDLAEGFTFARTVDEKELESGQEDDGLYILRTRVAWGSGDAGESEELVSYVWQKPKK